MGPEVFSDPLSLLLQHVLLMLVSCGSTGLLTVHSSRPSHLQLPSPFRPAIALADYSFRPRFGPVVTAECESSAERQAIKG